MAAQRSVYVSKQQDGTADLRFVRSLFPEIPPIPETVMDSTTPLLPILKAWEASGRPKASH
jgi:hypothetical protein